MEYPLKMLKFRIEQDKNVKLTDLTAVNWQSFDHANEIYNTELN